jgi:Transglutaminase-like superfamily
MGLIHLAEGVVFDAIDEEGRMLHTASGECLALDQIATILLQAGLQYPTYADALAYLHTCIDASDEQLEEGLQAVIQSLTSLELINTEQSVPPLSSLPPAQRQDRGDQAPFMSGLVDAQREPLQEHTLQRGTDWEVFLTGTLINSPLPRISLRQRLSAAEHTIRILLLMGCSRCVAYLLDFVHVRKRARHVRQREWSNICRSLSAILNQPTSALCALETEILVRLARRELVYCQMITRLLAPVGMCFVRSVAFCAYLRALGLPAQLVEGRPRFSSSSRFPFHAWVELAGRVVNDHEELQIGYVVWQRIPHDVAVVS